MNSGYSEFDSDVESEKGEAKLHLESEMNKYIKTVSFHNHKIAKELAL